MATAFNSFSPSNNHLGANLAFTKFLFVISRDDDASATRLRSAGGLIARGFFNDFDADGARDVQPHETIHFLVADLERHAYFYPHVDVATGCPASGHARSADAGISTIFRRLYHNPDGYARAGEYDFVTYFECEDEHVATFDRVCASLRDTAKNPEWK